MLNPHPEPIDLSDRDTLLLCLACGACYRYALECCERCGNETLVSRDATIALLQASAPGWGSHGAIDDLVLVRLDLESETVDHVRGVLREQEIPFVLLDEGGGALDTHSSAAVAVLVPGMEVRFIESQLDGRDRDPSDDRDLVLLLSTEMGPHESFVQARLEEAGIPFMRKAPASAFGTVVGFGAVEIHVERRDVERALTALRPPVDPEPVATMDDEGRSGEEPDPEAEAGAATASGDALAAFRPDILNDLEWRDRAGCSRLAGGGATLARLENRGADLAIAETADAKWEFVAHWSWLGDGLKSVEVRRPDAGDLLAMLPFSGESEGYLMMERHGGRLSALQWTFSPPCWQGEDDWLIRFHNTTGGQMPSARVEVDPAVAGLPELPLLIVLGWYLWLLSWPRSGWRRWLGS